MYFATTFSSLEAMFEHLMVLMTTKTGELAITVRQETAAATISSDVSHSHCDHVCPLHCSRVHHLCHTHVHVASITETCASTISILETSPGNVQFHTATKRMLENYDRSC